MSEMSSHSRPVYVLTKLILWSGFVFCNLIAQNDIGFDTFLTNPAKASEADFPEPLSRLFLTDGREIPGQLQSRTEQQTIWLSESGIQLRYPAFMVERIEFNEPKPEAADEVVNAAQIESSEEITPAAAEGLPEAPAAPEELVDQEIPPPLTRVYRYTATRMKQWTKRFELGARFVGGNSEERFLNTESRFETRCDHYSTRVDLGGKWGETPTAKTANNWYGNATADFGEVDDWIIFVTSQNQYDELQNLEYRGTLSSGIGYRFVDNEKCRAIVRVGPGVTVEEFMDQTEDRVTPDIFAEAEYQKPFFDRVKFEGKTTLKPSVEDLEVFRLLNNWALLTDLDEDAEWQFRISLNCEYNSQPADGLKKTDYTTLVGLVYTLK